MPWAGWGLGVGRHTAGWFTGNPGHTAGQMGGLPYESTGGGFRIGSAATSVMSFPRQMYQGKRDSGGELKPGLSLIWNKSGSSEQVVPDAEWRHMKRDLRQVNERMRAQRHTVVVMGPTKISGTLHVPGVGEAFVRGVVQQEMADEKTFEAGMRRRG
jgi:hypothetical protein